MKRRRVLDRLLVGAVVLIAIVALVDALRPRSRPPETNRPPAEAIAPASLAGCRHVARRLLLHGRRTSEYVKLPCGR